MKFVETIILLPCHSLEDFPTHNEGAEAEGMLSAWSCLWHPALLAATEKLPTWFRADGPPDELAGKLIVIPTTSESLLLAGWAARAKTEGAVVLRKMNSRADLVKAALEQLDGGAGGVNDDLAADFLALGNTYLWVELLTRQMRYMSNVDEGHLRNETVAAAQAALAGDEETARRHLRNCFDTLLEARERFYPVNAYIVDLTLVAPTTVGASLRSELSRGVPVNLLMSGNTLDTLAKNEPQTLDRLRLALDHKTCSIVGGEYNEPELPLLPQEDVLAELQHGLSTYEQHLKQRPTVYGRRRFGLTPVLPQILSRLGFNGALHLTLDDGQFPQSHQCKTRWEGTDGSSIDALSRLPLDAKAPESFLGLSRKIGESMDSDHVATLIFAHWPGDTSPFYEDLRRMVNYTPALGKFITLDDYFAYTDKPGETTRFMADQYRAPYLKQSVIRKQLDPLSRIAKAHREQVEQGNRSALETFAALLLREPNIAVQPTEVLAKTVAPAGGKQSAMVVVNPASFARHEVVDVTALGKATGAQSYEGKQLLAVEVPACGFATVLASNAPYKPARGEKPMAEGSVLRNEFFEIHIHETLGGIRAVYSPNVRGNRLSQQLAFRLPQPRPQPGEMWRDPDEDAQYSVMCCDEIRVTGAGPSFGEITTLGRLMDPQGKLLAKFTQAYRVTRGSRLLQLRGTLDITEQPRADGWNSYYAVRFAWPDAAPELWRSVGLTAQPTAAKRIEASDYIELRGEKSRLTLFPGGLPYHRYNGFRMLDTLVSVRGESQVSFAMAVGFDVLHPAQDAWSLYNPLPAVSVPNSSLTAGSTGWWFHVDAKNIVATHWQPTIVDGAVTGFRVRLLETEGKAGRVYLRSFTTPKSARQVDFTGSKLIDLNLDSDKVVIETSPYEWVEVEVVL
jgi:alpha-mannosidase